MQKEGYTVEQVQEVNEIHVEEQQEEITVELSGCGACAMVVSVMEC